MSLEFIKGKKVRELKEITDIDLLISGNIEIKTNKINLESAAVVINQGGRDAKQLGVSPLKEGDTVLVNDTLTDPKRGEILQAALKSIDGMADGLRSGQFNENLESKSMHRALSGITTPNDDPAGINHGFSSN